MNEFKKVNLDKPLAHFGPNAALTLRHCCESIMILGGIGSGKTSGSFAFLLRKLLAEKLGGVVLTVKPQEAEEYRQLCIEAGRENDLIVIEPGSEHSFNWLEYESQQTDSDKPLTDSIREIIKTCINAGAEKDFGKGDDGFWKQALDTLIGHVIDLCILAYGKVTLDDLYHIVQSLPKVEVNKAQGEKSRPETPFVKAWRLALKNVNAKRHKWHFIHIGPERDRTISREKFMSMLFDGVPEARLLNFLFEFFFDTFKNLNPKTRAIIEFSFSGFLYSLMRDPVYSLFANKPSTVTPDDCFRGKIILINLPVKKYHEVGRNSQLIVKLVCQRAFEKRIVDETSMPVFIASDEAQTFIHEHDTLFQATSRSARVITLAVSQNLSNFYSAMGEDLKHRVNSLIANFSTKIFHANTDMEETNEYASSLIGDGYFSDPSVNRSMSNDGFSRGQNYGVKRERILPPESFVSLKCGGPSNDYNVEAIIHRQGDQIFCGANHALVNFKQKITKS